ncbi:carbon monoxide dehydrogenase [Candidatus Desantisbacteria bacterium CG_4_10_14_0_8_um_filter_48_22]|uniref:Carbon monoxide dehydrogenase n=1 Tax=Candidatus Desantisbacteria bacterium CG_4_10_14_0_8_um_filter_48_22 TaxID=1974543 RepID=A0A2M7SDI6_9BACT|nr:MAG: carbon monoxide dehydrogenase [Candidatus Desantisbacteria bacterium CG1_02_49_89]PIV54301.1 MAG: carbon monoxide dehydrogenase [Candidatus Desantisbacteria bacterium CG02_land_8_20_14_3_00_49_13]PIZ17554.1 MAG: carbon monoxide dehydrogenase [Candidatus Desantisbacteria bacterium CG_4_10_14_0_8_um_filter_48_22]
MKIAISGKGGVGKTTLAALLAKIYSDGGKKVFAIDADPDANLAMTLGFPDPSKIVPLVLMKELIEERTGAKPGASSPLFKLNPRVDDIPDKYFAEHDGIKLAVMGTVRGGGLGCTCPENAFLKALLRHLIVDREEVVIIDTEAGIEHLGRGTVEAIDKLIVVAEPGLKSIETAHRIKKLAQDIGIRNIAVAGNKIRNLPDRKFIEDNLKDFDILGYIPYDEKIIQADMDKAAAFEYAPEILEDAKKILANLRA